MRIFYSKNEDILLLDSRENLIALYTQLQNFLSSLNLELEIVADSDINPAPYQKLLKGLRVYKLPEPIILSID